MFVFIRRIKQKSGQIGVSHRPSTFGQGVSFNLVIDGSAAIHQSGRRTIVQSVLLASTRRSIAVVRTEADLPA